MWDCVGCLFGKKRLLGKTLASWQDKEERKQFNHAPSDKARASWSCPRDLKPTSQTKPHVHAPCPNLRVELSV